MATALETAIGTPDPSSPTVAVDTGTLVAASAAGARDGRRTRGRHRRDVGRRRLRLGGRDDGPAPPSSRRRPGVPVRDDGAAAVAGHRRASRRVARGRRGRGRRIVRGLDVGAWRSGFPGSRRQPDRDARNRRRDRRRPTATPTDAESIAEADRQANSQARRQADPDPEAATGHRRRRVRAVPRACRAASGRGPTSPRSSPRASGSSSPTDGA